MIEVSQHAGLNEHQCTLGVNGGISYYRYTWRLMGLSKHLYLGLKNVFIVSLTGHIWITPITSRVISPVITTY